MPNEFEAVETECDVEYRSVWQHFQGHTLPSSEIRWQSLSVSSGHPLLRTDRKHSVFPQRLSILEVVHVLRMWAHNSKAAREL